MSIDEQTGECFQSNPARFIGESVKDFARSSPMNKLRAFGGTPIFDEPLVGFADGLCQAGTPFPVPNQKNQKNAAS